MDFLRYTNKRVVVSGCFSGMGEATARLLLEQGAEVHGIDYKPSTLDLASFTQADLRDPRAIDAAAAGIARVRNQRTQRRNVDGRVGEVEVVDAHETPWLWDVGHDLFPRHLVTIRERAPAQIAEGRTVRSVEPRGVVGVAACRNIVQMDGGVERHGVCRYRCAAVCCDRPLHGRLSSLS